MRIGMTGAGGTGKTTVLNILTERYPDIPVLPSPIRSVYARWGINEEDQEKMSFEEKLKLQEDIYQTRFATEDEYGHSFISDRTVLDHFCYQQIRCYAAMTQEMLDQKRKQIKQNMKKYDLICYFPITFTPQGDDIRYGNPVYQNMIDNFIFGEINKLGLSVLTVKAGSPEDRADYIAKFIDAISDKSSQYDMGFYDG